MTEQHPLTDKALEDLENSLVKSVMGQLVLPSDFNLARAAADWQLKQVLEWLNETIFERGSSFEAVNIPKELEEAMRPTTTTQENSQ